MNKDQKIPILGWGSFITAGVIFTQTKLLQKTTTDELIAAVVAAGALFLFYKLKHRIPIKNHLGAAFISFFIISITGAFLVGILIGTSTYLRARHSVSSTTISP